LPSVSALCAIKAKPIKNLGAQNNNNNNKQFLPGNIISVGQPKSTFPGFVPTSRSLPTTQCYHAASVPLILYTQTSTMLPQFD
jgi:hypothetical protein